MKTKLLLLAAMVGPSLLLGQSIYETATLDKNNFNATFNSFGFGFHDFEQNQPLSEIPKGSGKHIMFSSSLWIAGINAANLDTHVFQSTYPQKPIYEQASGPVANNYNSSWESRFGDRIWKIDRDQVDKHRSDWNKAGYKMPEVIRDWPANGDVANGEGQYLAPFVDLNHNGVYEPNDGEFPCFKGDQAVYMIFNDMRFSNQVSMNTLGIEVHVMAYEFETNSAVNNAIFVEYRILNKSSNTYRDLHVGMMNDFDLGCPNDDYLGCDTKLNMQFQYNGDNVDEDCLGLLGYGSNPPAAGMAFLNHTMTSSIQQIRGAGPQGDPQTEAGYYNLLMGKWTNGEGLVVGGTGIPNTPGASTTVTTFHYPGEPADTNTWTEITASNPPFDRRGVMGTGPFNFAPGNGIELAMVYLYARGTSDNIGSVADLKTDMAVVQDFYNNNEQKCFDWATGLETHATEWEVRLYPNPAHDQIQISISEEAAYEVYDAFGRLISKKDRLTAGANVISVTGWAEGLHFVRIYYEGETVVKRFVIQR